VAQSLLASDVNMEGQVGMEGCRSKLVATAPISFSSSLYSMMNKGCLLDR